MLNSPQPSQPVFTWEVLQPSDHLHCTPPVSFQQIHITLMSGTTDLDKSLQLLMRSHESRVAESPSSPCWPCCFQCSPGCCWLQAHSAGLCWASYEPAWTQQFKPQTFIITDMPKVSPLKTLSVHYPFFHLQCWRAVVPASVLLSFTYTSAKRPPICVHEEFTF